MFSVDSKLFFRHRTNSTVLMFLPHTQLTFWSVADLLLKHQIAPLSGEAGPGCGGILNDMDMAFYKYNTQVGNIPLPTERHSSSYGQKENLNKFTVDSKYLYDRLINTAENNCHYIMGSLISLLRQYQTSTLLPLSEEQRKTIKEKLTNARTIVTQIFVFQFIAAKWLIGINSNASTNKTMSVISKIPIDFFEKSIGRQFEITQELFMESEFFKVEQHKLKLRAVHLANNVTFCENEKSNFKEMFLPCLDEALNYPGVDYPGYKDVVSVVTCPEHYNHHVTKNELKEFYGITTEDSEIIANICKDAIEKIGKKIDLIFEILDGTLNRKFSPEVLLEAAEHCFPIGIILTNAALVKHAYSIDELHQEYRAIQPLVLGKDIEILEVANENLDELMQFLCAHKLENDIVVLDIHSGKMLYNPKAFEADRRMVTSTAIVASRIPSHTTAQQNAQGNSNLVESASASQVVSAPLLNEGLDILGSQPIPQPQEAELVDGHKQPPIVTDLFAGINSALSNALPLGGESKPVATAAAPQVESKAGQNFGVLGQSQVSTLMLPQWQGAQQNGRALTLGSNNLTILLDQVSSTSQLTKARLGS